MFVQHNRVLSFVLAFLLSIIPQLLEAASYSGKTEYELGQRVRTSMLENFAPVKDQALTSRVEDITRRIVRVADKRKGIDIEVTVIDNDMVGAWAFPGGFIFVTKPLIDLCENDDELAVVLGHEIAHEVKGHVDEPLEKRVKDQYADLLERMGVVGKGFVAEYSASDFTDEIKRQKELEADGYGILYTAMAGFDVSAAFPILAKLTADAGDAGRSHPPIPDRQKAIQIRLRRIMDRIEVFRAGVRFFEMGQYDDAIEAFTNFLNVFPSREVYNNIGVAFHKRALLHQTQNQTLQGMKTIRIDQETLAQGIRLRGIPKETPGEYPQRFRSDLRKAIQYYKQTIQQDPEYLIAYNNLGCAYDDMGDHDSADLYLRLAVAHEKNYKDAINNLGVVSMHRGKIEDAVRCFGEVVDLDPDFGPAILNMAVCYESKNDIATAQKYYKRFLSGNQLSSNQWIDLAMSRSGMKDGDDGSPEGSSEKVTGQLYCVSRLCLGDSVDKVVRLYGEPERKVIVLPSRNVSALVYPDAGLTALVETEKGVIGILANEKFRDQLEPNIRIGSSSIEVRHRFGAPDTIKVEAQEVMLYGYNRLGLNLRFRKDMLNEMDVYKKEQL